MRRLTLAGMLGALTLVLGCDDSPKSVCTPGISVACVGSGGCNGGQVCNPDGSGYAACDCGSVVLPDAGMTACDLEEQSACSSGERCTWVRLGENDGERQCAPDGVQPLNAACTQDESGLDDCASGGVCVGGKCLAPCDSQVPSSCGSGFTCSPYAGYVEGGVDLQQGFCVSSCNPVTQTRGSDGAPACGSPDPANPTLGCYGTKNGGFQCAPATDLTKRHGDEPRSSTAGDPYLNGCAPGYLPLLRSSSDPSSGIICVALCQPGETSLGNSGNVHGVSPLTCADRGAPGITVECRYWHFVEDRAQPATEWSNTIGFCMDHTQYSWDHDHDPGTAPVPFPSCKDLVNSDTDGDAIRDHEFWGCAPRE